MAGFPRAVYLSVCLSLVLTENPAASLPALSVSLRLGQLVSWLLYSVQYRTQKHPRQYPKGTMSDG